MSTNASNHYLAVARLLGAPANESALELAAIIESGKTFHVPFVLDEPVILTIRDTPQLIAADNLGALSVLAIQLFEDLPVRYEEVTAAVLVALVEHFWRSSQVVDLNIIDWDPEPMALEPVDPA